MITYCQKSDSESDIQLTRNPNEGEEGMECVGCSLAKAEGSFALIGTWMQYPMTLHLYEHLEAGHQIPNHVFDKLNLEIHE